MRNYGQRFSVCLGIWMICLSLPSCRRGVEPTTDKEVVLYSSVDEPYVTPLLKRFEEQTGLHVRFVSDTEATKSASLAERLEAEKDHPKADVYWGNEPFHTVNLAEQGLFATYRPAAADDVPLRWRDPADRYVGVGLRARVLAYSTRPKWKEQVAALASLYDLTRPELKGRIAVSNPGFGTASGHFASLYLLWGEEKYKAWLMALRANDVRLLGGNSVVADQIANGNMIAGLTDNDDLQNAKADGQPIDGLLPDQNGDGTLMLPTTLALVAGAPNSDGAKKLIEFLSSADVEKELIDRKFLYCSVRQLNGARAIEADPVLAARQMRRAVELALNILQDRKEGATDGTR